MLQYATVQYSSTCVLCSETQNSCTDLSTLRNLLPKGKQPWLAAMDPARPPPLGAPLQLIRMLHVFFFFFSLSLCLSLTRSFRETVPTKAMPSRPVTTG